MPKKSATPQKNAEHAKQKAASSSQSALPGLYLNHKGKVSDKWGSYIEFYEELFSPIKHRPVRILEIGIQNGGSLEIWGKYFPNAERIIGCDIAPAAADLSFADSRTSVVMGDATLPSTLDRIRALSDFFDIIIDDGSHRSGDIIKSFSLYFPLLRDGGLFIAEDLHCGYWNEFDGGLEAPFSSIHFFKRVADFVNREHWGLDVRSDVILDYFAKRYQATFAPDALDLISEVRFRNSICVVTKGAAGRNLIGIRQVSGAETVVEPGINAGLSGMAFVPSTRPQNKFGPETERMELAADYYPTLRAEIAKGKERVAALLAQNRSLTRMADALEADRSTLNATVSNLSRSLGVAQRYPHRLLGRKLEYFVLRALSRSRILPSPMVRRFVRSAAKRDPEQIDQCLFSQSTAPLLTIEAAAAEDSRVPQGILRRLAFHRSGKPRGWLRTIALTQRSGEVRPLFHRAFFKRNGSLRPDIAGFLRKNPDYATRFLSISEAEHLVSSLKHGGASAPTNREEVARGIFHRQQSELSKADADKIVANLTVRPLISVIMPVYNTPDIWLRRAITSLQEQFYDNWELCVVDDCSPTDEQRRLIEDISKNDPRIRLNAMPTNRGISAASNVALEMARGEFLALVDHDDEITPDALLRMVQAIEAEPETDFLYSDECKIDDTQARELFHFVLKPDWSPEIMFNAMITGHLTLYRTALVRDVGGFRSEYDYSQDYDLALRIAEVSRRIVHVERILYLWRAIKGSAAAGGKDFARGSNIASLADALKRRDIQGEVETLPHANRVRVDVPKEGSRVSIVIPSDSSRNLRRALDSTKRGTDYLDLEVNVVCNSRVAEELEREYIGWPVTNFIRYDKPYNFSDKCNVGAEAANGDIVVFYNDDVFPIGRDWVENLIEYLWVPGVGGTSPQLLYQNGTIQYAGMISGTPGMAGTAYHTLVHGHADSYLSMNRFVRNISILSGACCAVRRDLFLEIGGFDAVNTPDGHSDLDLSYKILAAGLRCVYTPYSLLTHIGNHSWHAKHRKYKADIFCLKNWGRYVSGDRYFTDTMREVLYADFTFEYHIHAEQVDPAAKYIGPDVLLVSHELTNTGAPHMVVAAAKAVKAAGGFPVVVAPADGPLRSALERENIVVIIDASIGANHFLFERFARNFDLAVVSTAALRPVVDQLATIPDLRTIWWFHESMALSTGVLDVRADTWDNVEAVCVSEYAAGFLPKEVPFQILSNGVSDDAGNIEAYSATIDHSDKLTFINMGTIEPRKGQDIFVEAAIGLPDHIREMCRFVIVGKLWPMHEGFWGEILDKMAPYPEFEYVGDMPHCDALALIAACDVNVCCSRDDAFSLVAAEAAMMGKPSILSDHVGIREVLDETCSSTFPSEDVEQLRHRMIEAYEDRDRLLEMGLAARRIYEERLTEAEFSRNFMKVVESSAAGNDAKEQA